MSMLTVTNHTLIGLNGSVELCSCGDKSRSHLEHLADVALADLGEPRHRHPDDVHVTDAEFESSLAVLAELADEADAFADALNATGLSTFAERADWCLANLPPDRAVAWRLHWLRLGIDVTARPRRPYRRRPAPIIPLARQLEIAIASLERKAG